MLTNYFFCLQADGEHEIMLFSLNVIGCRMLKRPIILLPRADCVEQKLLATPARPAVWNAKAPLFFYTEIDIACSRWLSLPGLGQAA
jgi:hypothetical protein